MSIIPKRAERGNRVHVDGQGAYPWLDEGGKLCGGGVAQRNETERGILWIARTPQGGSWHTPFQLGGKRFSSKREKIVRGRTREGRVNERKREREGEGGGSSGKTPAPERSRLWKGFLSWVAPRRCEKRRALGDFDGGAPGPMKPFGPTTTHPEKKRGQTAVFLDEGDTTKK